jgi:bifunctional non-homologous end joining protein LigD
MNGRDYSVPQSERIQTMSLHRASVLGHQGFIEPCLPSRTTHPPLGRGWLHEIKYDGFRLMARRDARSVRLLTRRGYDWTQRLRLIADAISGLRCRSCLIDGEAVACDEGGIPVFKLLVRNRMYTSAQLYAFDLLELDGQDLHGEPIEVRKKTLSSATKGPPWASDQSADRRAS